MDETDPGPQPFINDAEPVPFGALEFGPPVEEIVNNLAAASVATPTPPEVPE